MKYKKQIVFFRERYIFFYFEILFPKWIKDDILKCVEREWGFLIIYKGFESLDERCKYIFSVIQGKGPMSKNELIGMTKIKSTTLNRSLKILLDDKLIVESDLGESTGGRKPCLYDVNRDEYYIIGIDISRTYTKIVITNLKLDIKGERLLSNEYNVDTISEMIPDAIEELSEKVHIKDSYIIGIGIGIVDGFDALPLKEELEKNWCNNMHR